MIALVVCLLVGLVLAVVVGLVLAVTLPGRVSRLVIEEQRATEQARAAKVAFEQAVSAELSEVIVDLRAYREQSAHLIQAAPVGGAAGEAGQLVVVLRAWRERPAGAEYAQGQATPPAGGAAVETSRMPDRATPASRERAATREPAPALVPLPPGPGLVAAGLGPRPRPAPRTGLGDSGAPRRTESTSPTMPSMPAIVMPSARPSPSVTVQSCPERRGDGALHDE